MTSQLQAMLPLTTLDQAIKAAAERKEQDQEAEIQREAGELLQKSNLLTKDVATAAEEMRQIARYLDELKAREEQLAALKQYATEYQALKGNIEAVRALAKERTDFLTVDHQKLVAVLEQVNLQRAKLDNRLAEIRKTKPKVEEAADPEDATVGRLLEAAKVTKIASHTRGMKLAVLGGVPGRASAQTIQRVLTEALELKDLIWYASRDNGGQGGIDTLMQSLKFGGVGMVLVYAQMSGHHYGLYDLCKKRNVPVITMHTASPKVALVEVAKFYNVAAGPFLDA